jgi:hypothetical protein
MPKSNPEARLLLLPLLRSDDLGIEAGEVLVDLVLAVVCGFLCSRESQQSEHFLFPASSDC